MKPDKLTEKKPAETAENTAITVKKTSNRGKGLTPFKKGAEWTGNKGGRPKGSRSLTTLFREAFEQIRKRAKEKDGTIIEDPEIDVIISLVGGAKKGVPKLVETYMKYKYGQPTIPIDLDVSVNSESEEIEAMVSTFTKLLKNHD